MGDLVINGIDIPDIDIRDQDTRPLAMTFTGADDDVVIDVAFAPIGVEPEDGAYVACDWTDETQTAVDLLLGLPGGFDLTELGAGIFYPNVRLTDGATIVHGVGPVPLLITQLGTSVV